MRDLPIHGRPRRRGGLAGPGLLPLRHKDNDRGGVRLAFGSCRVSVPHEPPYTRERGLTKRGDAPFLPADRLVRAALHPQLERGRRDRLGYHPVFGAGIVLGSLLSETSLAETMGTAISNALGLTSLLTITLLATVVAILISETTSNTASVGIVVPHRHPNRQHRRRRAPDPGFGRDIRRLLRLHAPGLHAAERGRLRLRHDPHNQDGPLGRLLRRHRRRPDRGRRDDHGPGHRPRARGGKIPRR